LLGPMKGSTQILIRAAVYGILLAGIDAVSGRTLQASPDPSVLLALFATAWVAYRLAEQRRGRLALPAALTLWAAYAAAFVAFASALVGWNGSVPWEPRSTMWMISFAVAAPVVAVLGRVAGSLAAKNPDGPVE
jgi:peptidoglycan/LPS O-acetylase OafA/YrhL